MLISELGVLPKAQWLSALDASGLPMSAQAAVTQGIAVFGASSALRQLPAAVQFAGQLGGIGTGPCTAGPAAPRPRAESVYSTRHHTNSTVKQYATSVDVGGGVGTSGPPRRQKPA